MMTYMEIAKELDVPKEEAEQYIVNAVQMGLVEGRMDQIKEEFAVTCVCSGPMIFRRTQCIVEYALQDSAVEKERPVCIG